MKTKAKKEEKKVKVAVKAKVKKAALKPKAKPAPTKPKVKKPLVKAKAEKPLPAAVKPPAAEKSAPKPVAAPVKPVAPAPKPAAVAPKPVPVVPKPVPVVPKPAVAPVKPAPAVPKPVTAAPPLKPAAQPVPETATVMPIALEPVALLKEVELELPITVKDLAIKIAEKPSSIIKFLMDMRIMVGINQALDEEIANKICAKYNCRIKKAPDKEETVLALHQDKDDPKSLIARSPVVTFMGHVDHGKTSLMDAIRKTKVAESEHGGITQHIGAYMVNLPHGVITFLDTPGHEAFTAMRARGAAITDIVVLVVAADDGVMPQTLEAIDHARAAGVTIMVALNKMDKAGADPDKVKKQLAKADLNPEDWGGKTITVPVSAKTGSGVDNLLEMILLEAQMLELRANPKRLAKGVVIEAKMSKGRGPVSTLLVQNGTLHLNENIIVGNLYGKVRAMFDSHGRSVTTAGPSVPVEILGISGIPAAGEQFYVIADEKEAKQLAEARAQKDKEQQVKSGKRVSLEDLHSQIQEGRIKELKLVVKADVQGSLEAIKDTLLKLNVSEIKIDIIHAGVGNINNSDVILAMASNALILGFNVECDELAKELSAKEGVDVKIYNIIYELANDIKAALEGMLEPKTKKVFLGRAEIRKVLRLSRAGTIAGCYVSKGKFLRTSIVSLVRNGAVVHEGKLASLKRFKDDVREVAEGFECGMSIAGFDQIMEGDIIEAYDIEKIARKL